MDVALVEHAQHDVDRDDGGQDKPELVRERRLEGERRALEPELRARRKADVPLRRLDGLDGVAERRAARQVERDGRRGKLAGPIDDERRGPFADPGQRRQRNLLDLARRRTLRALRTGQVDAVERVQVRPGTSAAPPVRRDTGWFACRSWKPGAGRTRCRARC